MGASGRTGIVGAVADRFDSLPVKGALAAAIAVGGAVVALAHGGLTQGTCQDTPLQHVYNPKRLTVIERCAHVTGTVVTARREHDGDWHVDMRMDTPGWTDAANARGQHGLTVVEFVPLDPRPSGFKAGERLSLVVTKVYDEQHKLKVEDHGWIEGHPVFSYRVLDPGGRAAPQGPAVQDDGDGR